MKVLLVNPPRDHSISSEVPTTVNAETNTMPPLGLMYLEAYLQKHSDHRAVIIDCLANHWHLKDFQRLLQEENPDLVGVTGHTHDLLDMLEISRATKEFRADLPVWWGGPHASDFPTQSLAYANVDGCVINEGEIPFLAVLNALEKQHSFDEIPGICFRKTDGIVCTNPAQAYEDLNELPFPRREVIDYRKYSYVLGTDAVCTSLLTSRGCPYRCNFCNTPGHATWRWRSAQSIVDEMEACQKLGIHEIYIVDDTFNVKTQRTMEICQEIMRRKLHINWNIRARANLLTKETVAAMAQAGCTRVHIGVESGTDAGMAALNKQLTTEQVRQGFKLLQDAKMTTVCYFMIGCPHEKSREDVLQTVDFAIELDPDYALFGVLTPYPNTALYDEGVKRGILKPQLWDDFLRQPYQAFKPQVWTESFSGEELGELCDLAFKRFYLRPKQAFRKLLEITNFNDLRRKMKAGWEILKL